MYNDDLDTFDDFEAGFFTNSISNNNNNNNSINNNDIATFSQTKADQIKDLGLDDTDISSDEDDEDDDNDNDPNIQKTSSISQHQNQINTYKRTLSTESTNNFDNDYDGYLNDENTKKFKNNQNLDFDENIKNELNNSLNDNKINDDGNYNKNNNHDNNNYNNSNDVSFNNDDADNSKEKKDFNTKAKEKAQIEKERILKKKKEQEEECKKMQVLMANFSDEQLNRYEMYRRSAFPKANVKRIVQTVCGKSVSADVVIAMSGMAKVFVGEMVELALDIQQKSSETGPLHPKHIREAFRVYKKGNKISSSYKQKKPSILL